MLNLLTKAILSATASVSYAFSTVSNFARPYINANYKFNSSHSFDGFIFDQCGGSASLLKMGYYDGSYNGCGWVAAYNAAIIMGVPVHPSDIIRYYEKNGGLVLNGLLGTNPAAVKAFLRSTGLKAEICHFPHRNKLDRLIKVTAACVLVYAHKRGMHFVAVEYKGGEFRVYNEYRGATGYTCRVSVEEWLRHTRFKAVSLIQIDYSLI